jgi:ribulose-phosphate 3-epimerase
MVNNLDKYINDYNMYNTEYITIHYEAMLDTNVISKIKSYGIKCGISIKPSTQVEQIFDLLDKIDLVLIMSVEPGEGGQEFIDSSYEKIYKLKQEIKRRNLNVKISIDGGINEKNIKTCIDKGIDIVVLGSYMLKIQNIKEEVDKLKDIV